MLAGLPLLVLLAPSSATGQSTEAPRVAVKSIRYWSLGQVTRVAVELSEEGRFRTETLQGPDRFFVDILNSRLEIGDRRPQTIKVDDPLVRQVRVGGDEARTRVVLDLNRKVETEVSQLSNPYRIMIEVRAPGGKTPAPLSSAGRTNEERLDSPKATSSAAEKPTKPQPANPEPLRSEVARMEPAKRTTARSGAAKPEAAKLEGANPASAQPGASSRAEALVEAPAPAADPAPATADSTPPRTPAAAGIEGVALAEAPKPAKPRSGGNQSLVRALGLKLGKVVIDPGHGGHDHGTTGPTGLIEKDLVLEVALKLGAMIEEKLGSEVVYTRTSDIFIPLEERTAIANRHKADLFISVHANSSPYKKVSGAEVYYLNFTTSKDALEVAARENAGHGKSIFELRDLIQKIALKDKADESREFAGRLQTSLHGTWIKLNAGARNRGVKRAPFVVLIGASMPSVLAEVGFLSNPKDEQTLRKPDARLKLAEALFRGVQQYASTLSEMKVARAGGEVGGGR